MKHLLFDYNIYGQDILDHKGEILSNFKRNTLSKFDFKVEISEKNIKELELLIIKKYTEGDEEEQENINHFLDDNFLEILFYLGETWIRKQQKAKWDVILSNDKKTYIPVILLEEVDVSGNFLSVLYDVLLEGEIPEIMVPYGYIGR